MKNPKFSLLTKDSKGKEIFSGDILVAPSGMMCLVAYISEEMAFKLLSKDGVTFNINSEIWTKIDPTDPRHPKTKYKGYVLGEEVRITEKARTRNNLQNISLENIGRICHITTAVVRTRQQAHFFQVKFQGINEMIKLFPDEIMIA